MKGRVTKAMLGVATLGLALSGQISSAPHAGATTTRIVTNLNDSGTGSLRAQIAAAVPGDIIIFGVAGEIALTSGELVINKDLAIKGPLGGKFISAQNRSRVFNVTAGTVSLDRLTIYGGFTQGSLGADSAGYGAGIYNAGTLSVTNSSVGTNVAEATTGGESRGGGIYNDRGLLTISNSSLGANNATFGSGFLNHGQGGAIYNSGGTVNIANSTFDDNQALTSSGISEGGAIFNSSGSLTVNGSTFLHNQAVAGGALADKRVTDNKMSVTNCTFTSNTAIGGTGSIPAAGAIEARGSLSLVNSTIGGNSGSPGGIAAVGSVISMLVRNTIVAANTATSGSAPDLSGPFTSQGHNLIGATDNSSGWVASDLTGTAAAPLDPQLGSLQYNGGPTQTMALAGASPAVNAGDDAVLSSPYSLTTDQRGTGFPRKLGTHVDVGAYELDASQAGPSFTVTTNDDHDDGVCGVVDCTVREAFNAGNAAAGSNTVRFASGVVGAIVLDGIRGQLVITDATTVVGPGATTLALDGNNATEPLFVSAPGLAVSISGLTIRNGRVAMPVGAGDAAGGGLYNNASLTMTNCALTNNHVVGGDSFGATGGAGQGGAVYNAGTLTMTACTMSTNGATGGAGGDGGGGAGGSGGAGQGGALFNAGTLTLRNSTVSGNVAQGGTGGAGTPAGLAGSSLGGGVYNTGTFSTDSDTVAANSAHASGSPSNAVAGGGIYQASGKTTLRNTIVAGNTGASGPDAFGPFTSTGFNLIGKGDGSTGLTNGVNHDQVGSVATPRDPKLSALRDNGGPTPTQALLAGSPAIDQGSTTRTTDQRGLTRPFDDPAVANAADGNATDIGAVERHGPTLSVNDVSVNEGDSGTVTATFTVSLIDPGTQTATVQYQTADGTATAPADYNSRALTTLSLSAGVPTRTASVTVKADLLDEDNETFFLDLSSPTNAVLGKARGVGTVNDNDEPPALRINDVTVSEGDTGSLNAGFAVSLTQPSGRAVSVKYATANGTATAPADYTAVPATTLTIPAGAMSATANVAYNGDISNENTENFFVNLSSPVNATIADSQGVGTILDNDPLPTIAVNDVTVTEGTGGTATANFTVSLNTPSGQAVTVQYATANSTATAPTDYTARALTTLTFSPGQTAKTVSVPIVTDATDEPDETFLLNLSAPTNAVIQDPQGMATIVDDDVPPTVSVNDVRVTEGNGAAVNATFTLTLSHVSGKNVTVQYATADGTATAPADYGALAAAAITFNPGQVTKTVSVPIHGDTLDEPDETFSLNLSTPTNATVGDGQGQATIVDDDATPSLSINDVSASEGNTGTTNFDFTVKLSAASGQTVTVSYATADGTALAPGDYGAVAPTTLTFAPGETTKTVTVAVVGDTVNEPNEAFTVDLSAPTNATISDAQGIGTIQNDDP